MLAKFKRSNNRYNVVKDLQAWKNVTTQGEGILVGNHNRNLTLRLRLWSGYWSVKYFTPVIRKKFRIYDRPLYFWAPEVFRHNY